MSDESQIDTLDGERLDEVRRRVRELLESSPSYVSLPEEERRRMAGNLVRIVGYLADESAGKVGAAPGASGAPLAVAQATTPVPPQELTGKDFEAGGVDAGIQGFGQLVDTVDFPEFVRDLIDGVFNSIVDASIRQMEAYAKMLEAVVKSVDDFARDEITDNEGRNFLQDKFPNIFELAIDDDQPRLQLGPNADEDALPDFQTELGMSEPVNMDSEDWEQQLVRNAKLEMARMRQQQLSAMVMLGINRIVVTDGKINAKVKFKVHAEDSASRRDATHYDQFQRVRSSDRTRNLWGTSRTRTRTTVNTRFQQESGQESDSRVDAEARLTGEVSVNFKSDFFPMEKIASVGEIKTVEERAQR